MALFQSYGKFFSWGNKKVAKQRKIVDMRLRSGRKTLNGSQFVYQIPVPNQTSKEDKKHSERIVKLVKKKAKKTNLTNNLVSLHKQYKSKGKTNSLHGSSFSQNKSQQSILPMNSTLNRTIIFHSSEVTNQPPSLNLPVTSTSDQSVISGSCQVRDLSTVILHFSATSTPKQSGLNDASDQPSISSHVPMTSASSQVMNHFLETPQSFNNYHNSNNQCTRNSVNTRNNYYSLISDTSLPSINNNSDTLVVENNSLDDNRPLTVDAMNTARKRSRRKKWSVLKSIINQEPDRDEQDETIKITQKRKRSVSVKHSLSSVAKCSGGQTDKDEEVCSVICVPSDDEVVILESEVTSNLKSNEQSTGPNTRPSKRQKTSSEVSIIMAPNLKSKDQSDVPNTPSSKRQTSSSEVAIIDLCTPEQSSNQMKNKSGEKNDHNCFPLPRIKSLKKSRVKKSRVKKSRSRIRHPNNFIFQNQLTTSSRKKVKALREYVSILGTVGQRGPFPNASSTVISFPNASSTVTSLPNASSTVTSLPNASSTVTSSSTNNEAALTQDPNVPTSSKFGSNIYNPNPTQQIGLRPIVIDGSNVAFGHSNGAYFSCQGLKFCIEYFLKRNHKVLAFVPKFRKHDFATKDPKILDDLEKLGLVSFTPSRKVHGKLVVSYDDRYIVQYAAECGGVIVSTDNYQDLIRENYTWKETIEKRLLMFTWAGDVLIFPQDPLGRYGPRLEQFLRFP